MMHGGIIGLIEDRCNDTVVRMSGSGTSMSAVLPNRENSTTSCRATADCADRGIT